ncbi:GTP-binding protein [Roseospirillum parvum]|uniref:Flagellar biosynthesis protein FlhF n=1 Tax=Roseospirillum parvum TaxID=83401 RepID=A0A1G7W9J1_9PROT|nr:GTP-binding protein [Roseospirillum parvum]SDG68644.1 SRP54-type protein, GTPase domain [Roseospirillum parvum]
MRLKCFTADSMTAAMAQVRAELGDDAIIVSTQRMAEGQGVRITAALEESAIEADLEPPPSGQAPSLAARLAEELEYHRLPEDLAARLMSRAVSGPGGSAADLLAGALDGLFTFAPLPERAAPRAFMVIGPPASGKTITVAKLAARGRIANRSVAVISADVIRAGALGQLSAFTDILGIELGRARGPQSLAARLRDSKGGDGQRAADLVFIDSPGINPFNDQDLDYLAALLGAAEVEPVLTLAAGGDPLEMAEMAEVFAGLGATRLLPTRLDLTRRLGGVLAAADAAGLSFCNVSASPHVASGLSPLSADVLARLLLPPELAEARAPAIAEAPPSATPAPGRADPNTKALAESLAEKFARTFAETPAETPAEPPAEPPAELAASPPAAPNRTPTRRAQPTNDQDDWIAALNDDAPRPLFGPAGRTAEAAAASPTTADVAPDPAPDPAPDRAAERRAAARNRRIDNDP